MNRKSIVFIVCLNCILLLQNVAYGFLTALIGVIGIGAGVIGVGGGATIGFAWTKFENFAKGMLNEHKDAIEAYAAAHSPIATPTVRPINIDDFPETRDMLGIKSSEGPFYMVTEDYTFYNLDGTSVTIPKGFIFDGASIPKKANLIIDGTAISPDMLAAGLIHDYMYRHSGYSKDYADMMIFINAFLAGNPNPAEIWAGLYYRGDDAYNDHEMRRNRGDYDVFDNITGGRDYYAGNYARYDELNGSWTPLQRTQREGPTVFRDIWSDMNDLGLLKNCLGGEAWNYPVNKITVLAVSESSTASGFGTSAGAHSTIEILASQQPSLDYKSSFEDPTSADAKNALTAVHELFLVHMYQVNPWSMVGSSFSVNTELNQGFAIAMTWLYAQKQGLDFEVFSNNMMDANAKGNNRSSTFKSFLKSVMPDADVSTAEGLASAANRLSADMVYDYINKKAAGIEAVSRMQIRKILDATKGVGDQWKENLTDNIMAMVNKGADPWTAYAYAKAVAENNNDDVRAEFAKMQSEMKASQREKCNSCTDNPTSPSTGEGSGNGNENGGSGNSNGSGNPGSGGTGGAGSGGGAGGGGNAGSGGNDGSGSGGNGGAGSGAGGGGGGGDGSDDGLPYSCDELSEIRARAQMAINAYADRGDVADGYRPRSGFLNSDMITEKWDLLDENGERAATVFGMPYVDADGVPQMGYYCYDYRNGLITPWKSDYEKQYRELAGGDGSWVDVAMPDQPDFVAQVLEREGQLYIVFAGTATGKDWIENYKQWKGDVPPQFQMADFLTQCAQRVSNGKVTLVGHSEGGGEVQYAILRSLERENGNIAGVTFNSQRLSEEVLASFEKSYRDAAAARISNFVMSNDAVSGLGVLGEDLLGDVTSLGGYCTIGNDEGFCLYGGYGIYRAHLMETVIDRIDEIIERQCGNQGGNSGGSGGNGGAGSGAGGGGGGGGGDGSGGAGSGGGSGGGSGTGTGGGSGTGEGTNPGDGSNPGDGLPVITTPLPDFPLPSGGTRPWDNIVGFTIPYDRALFLFSGDVPVKEDFRGAWNGLSSVFSSLKNAFEKGLDLSKFTDMWDTLQSGMWNALKEKIDSMNFDDESNAIEQQGKARQK